MELYLLDFKELINVYDKNFGFFTALKNSLKSSKWILLSYSLIIISAVGFYFVYIMNTPNKLWWMIALILIYIASIVWSGFIHVNNIKREFKSIKEYEDYKLTEINKFIKKELGLKTVKQYELLDSLVKKEIEISESIRKFPFSNTIRQLLVAVLITGLLSYSFKEMISGNKQIGFSLLELYLMIIGTIIIIGVLIYSLRDYDKINKLKHISRIISELLIKISKTENDLEEQKKEVNEERTNKKAPKARNKIKGK